MGLKGYRLWVMGQLDSNVQRHTEELAARRRPFKQRHGDPRRGVALQVCI
jgi:hypothetical protein